MAITVTGLKINKEREEERQRAKAADKRMERFERGFKGQFMYER